MRATASSRHLSLCSCVFGWGWTFGAWIKAQCEENEMLMWILTSCECLLKLVLHKDSHHDNRWKHFNSLFHLWIFRKLIWRFVLSLDGNHWIHICMNDSEESVSNTDILRFLRTPLDIYRCFHSDQNRISLTGSLHTNHVVLVLVLVPQSNQSMDTFTFKWTMWAESEGGPGTGPWGTPSRTSTTISVS